VEAVAKKDVVKNTVLRSSQRLGFSRRCFLIAATKSSLCFPVGIRSVVTEQASSNEREVRSREDYGIPFSWRGAFPVARMIDKSRSPALTAARRCGPRELVGYENVESTQPITIGVLSERTGVGIETIRYYERIGILPKPPRTLADTDTMPKKIDRA